MYDSPVADLGISPEVWLFLSLLGCVSLYFKFNRFWSVRNLDLLLLFVLTPGLMMLVGNGGGAQAWVPFALLFLGSLLWIVRCLLDLGMSRRPLLEPNMNAAGLTCLAIGILGLMLAETVSLPLREGAQRNPADPGTQTGPKVNNSAANKTLNNVLVNAPLPTALVETASGSTNPAQVILSRVLASLAHLALVLGLIAVGWWHFDRPLSGLAMATCYLILPYSRLALDDSGQLVPAALIVAAVAFYDRPLWTGVFLGLAAGWMPAGLGLVPLWAGFYRQRGSIRFVIVGLSVVVACGALGLLWPDMASWARAFGARSLADAGLLPTSGAPLRGSFWTGIDVAYRLPVLIGYLALVVLTTIWPWEKNLGDLIALSAALLVASQFWYLERGGTLVLLYLPLLLLMMFRPNLAMKRPALLGAAKTSK